MASLKKKTKTKHRNPDFLSASDWPLLRLDKCD